MDAIEVRPGLYIPDHELTETATRSGGPGGQHVNKTSTRIVLRWSVRDSTALTESIRARLLARLATRLTSEGELLVAADSSRSQFANREEARERLAAIVRDALVVQKTRFATAPSKAVKRRRIQDKKTRSEVKKGRGKVGHDD